MSCLFVKTKQVLPVVRLTSPFCGGMAGLREYTLIENHGHRSHSDAELVYPCQALNTSEAHRCRQHLLQMEQLPLQLRVSLLRSYVYRQPSTGTVLVLSQSDTEQ
jgi:hypothetical protein